MMGKQSLVLTILMITMALNIIVTIHYIHTESKDSKYHKRVNGME